MNDGTADSASSYTMTVDVTPMNDAPVVSAITATKTENDSSFVTDLTAGQTDLKMMILALLHRSLRQ